MDKKYEIKLAERIIKLDRLRDQLYEKLQDQMGSNAQELLRKIQISK